MKWNSVFFGLAWLAGILSLVLPQSGHLWTLVDHSLSVGQESENSAKGDSERVFFFAENLSRSPSGVGDRRQSRLRRALTSMADRMAPGDRLLVHTDGRSTDGLPSISTFSGRQVKGAATPSLPRILALEAPQMRPTSGLLEVRVQLAISDPEAGYLALAGSEGQTVSPRFFKWEPGSWLHLGVELESAGEIQLRWTDSDGVAERSFFVGDPGARRLICPQGVPTGSTWVVVGSGQEAEGLWWTDPPLQAWGQLGQAQQWTVLVSDDPAFWAAAPPGQSLFLPQPPIRPVTVLLDRSGSMGQANLDAALHLLEKVSRGGGHWQVWPFGADLEAPFALPSEGRLLAHGPTDLENVLNQLLRQGPSAGDLLLLADGNSAAPSGGWALLGETLSGHFDRTYCIPSGEQAQLSVLSQLGQLQTGDSLSDRLREATREIFPQRNGTATVVQPLWFDFPSHFSLPQDSPSMALAPGAVPVVVDARGSVLAAARLSQGVTCLGWAVDPNHLDSSWLEAFAASLTGGTWHRKGQVVQYFGDAGARVGLQDSALRTLVPGPAGNWQSGPWPDTAWLQATTSDGQTRLLAPIQDEFSASELAWFRWLAAGQDFFPKSIQRHLLLAALLCFSVALFWSGRRSG